MSVNNITSKILRDAEGRKESILAAAEEEKNKILSKKVASATELETDADVLSALYDEVKIR